MQLQKLTEAMIDYMGGDARRIQHFTKVMLSPTLLASRRGWTLLRSLFWKLRR